jgi:subtilisin-like proprotein convertase family protein
MAALSAVLGAVLAVPALAETREFENTTAFQIPADEPASVYPSSIDVSGMGGPDREATVTLHGLSHENLKDLAVLLVGPGGGRGVVLMASYDLSGSGSYAVSNTTLKFKDESEPVECSLREGLLPNFPGSEGAYAPFNCGLVAPFPAPAPREPYGYGLEAEETDGVWSLYVDNDMGDQEGRIAGGWSLHITTQGSFAPTDTALPSISGIGAVGQTLSCSEGSWIDGFAAVSFGYQWLRDGSPVADTASTYVVQAADRGHTLTCEVTASNSAGDSAATSAGVAISAGSSGGGPAVSSPSGSSPVMGVTATQNAALLAGQLTPSGKTAKIAALLRRGECTVALRALEAGTAVIDWYDVPPGAQLARNRKAKPILIASGGRRFAAAGTAIIKIKLTAAGKSVLKHVTRIELTALSTFTPAGKAPITATGTFVLKQ